MVTYLAQQWEKRTGKRFTQNWQGGTPLTEATQFVYDIVKDIAPEQLRSLPKVTARIVRTFRN